MKFLFLANPTLGHLNPELGVVQEIVKQGHKVITYNTPESKKKVQSVGAFFRPPPFPLPEFDVRTMNDPLNIVDKQIEVSRIAVPALLDVCNKERFDCILHDSFNLWAKLIAQKLNLPAVSFIPSMGLSLKVLASNIRFIFPDLKNLLRQPVRFTKILSSYKILYKNSGCPVPFILDIFTNEEKLNIVFTSEFYQPFAESFNSTYKFVGPVIYKRREPSLPDRVLNRKKPIIYIALGTAFNDDRQIYRNFVSVLADSAYQVLISIGSYLKRSDFPDLPPNIYIDNYLPQIEALKKASLFISHAGMNSINESLYFGVPLLMFPIIQEQRANANRVENLGGGIYWRKKDTGRKELLNVIEKLLTDKSIRTHVRKIQKSLKSAGGAKSAVRHILNYLKPANQTH